MQDLEMNKHFIAAIKDDPTDKFPWSAYGDWLEEQGDGFAELVRSGGIQYHDIYGIFTSVHPFESLRYDLTDWRLLTICKIIMVKQPSPKRVLNSVENWQWIEANGETILYPELRGPTKFYPQRHRIKFHFSCDLVFNAYDTNDLDDRTREAVDVFLLSELTEQFKMVNSDWIEANGMPEIESKQAYERLKAGNKQ